MAIGTRRHKLLTGDNVGSIVRWTVADSTARLALLLTVDDVGAVAKQTDDNSYHILANYTTPTWVQLGATVNVISSANTPTVNDDELDGYEVGSLWIRTAAGSEAFYCLADATAGAAVWVLAAGGGAAAAWGTITGTLSAQTDLQNALDAKKPLELSGAGAPGVSTGNGLALGTIYVDTTGDAAYTLVDATTDANVWSAGGGGAVDSVFGRTGDVVAVAGDYDDTEVSLASVLGTPTISDVEALRTAIGSVSTVNGGGNITDDGDGTITVSAGSGFIRATDSDDVTLYTFDFAAESGANVALTVSDMNYVYVEYNAGTPRVVATISKRTDYNTNILLGTVYRNGTLLHITNHKNPSGNVSTKLTRRFNEVDGLVRATGLVTSETGTRNIAVTAGAMWHGLDESLTTALDTAVADTFIYYYRDGIGGWTVVNTQTQINNANYDDGDGTLGVLGASKYGVHWVYRAADDDLYVVYGRGNYVAATAAAAQPPGDVPPHFDEHHALLIAKIVIQQGAATFAELELAWTANFSGSAATDHGGLAGLGDDDHAQYLLADGTRTLTDNLAVTALKTIDGRDLSVDGTKLDGVEALADVTDTANVTAAGALMDSEVDADLKTFALPANTTISAFGATLVDDADAATARTTLGAGDVVGPASATSGAVALFDGTTGKLLKDLGATFTAASGGRLYVGMTNAYMRMKEKTTKATAAANFGDFWVKDDIPCRPKFTDDTNVEHYLMMPLSGAGAPGAATGNGYPLGTTYADTTNDVAYILVDNTASANVWSRATAETHILTHAGGVNPIQDTWRTWHYSEGPYNTAQTSWNSAAGSSGTGSRTIDPEVKWYHHGLYIPRAITITGISSSSTPSGGHSSHPLYLEFWAHTTADGATTDPTSPAPFLAASVNFTVDGTTNKHYKKSWTIDDGAIPADYSLNLYFMTTSVDGVGIKQRFSYNIEYTVD